MITATSQQNAELVVEGKTLKEIYSKLCGMLSVSGPRALTVETDTGAKIRASLYDGESYIRSATGKLIYQS